MDVEKAKLERKLDFFRSMAIFKNWTFYQLKRLYYQFEQIPAKVHSKIFTEGESANDIYIIKSGEFLVWIMREIKKIISLKI